MRKRPIIFFHKLHMFQPKLLQPSQIIQKDEKLYATKPLATAKYSNGHHAAFTNVIKSVCNNLKHQQLSETLD